MKSVIYLTMFAALVSGLIGCQTVPRQMVREEVVIYYYEPPIPEPCPIPDPPGRPIINPIIYNPAPPRDHQPVNPSSGGSYSKRDPLQGGSNRKSEKIRTTPPVKNPERNGRVQ